MGSLMPLLLSGGADGADTLFGQEAKKVGHDVRHYTFGKYYRNSLHDSASVMILTDEQLKEADPALKRANETLHRRFPTHDPKVDNLLRRNYWQIKTTEAVYAVAPLEAGKYIIGGTAWAVQMAIDRKVKPIYLFNLVDNKWYFWAKDHWFQLNPLNLIAEHWDRYTGIGSRQLTPEGKEAIRKLYVDDNITNS